MGIFVRVKDGVVYVFGVLGIVVAACVIDIVIIAIIVIFMTGIYVIIVGGRRSFIADFRQNMSGITIKTALHILAWSAKFFFFLNPT